MSRYKKNKKKIPRYKQDSSYDHKTFKLKTVSHEDVHSIAYKVFGALTYTSEKNQTS
jgi:hypothetical protein